MPGIYFEGALWEGTLIFALVFSLLNASLGQVIKKMGCLLQVLTLGLFGLFVNAWLIQLSAKLIGGMHVESLGQAVFLGLIISLSLAIFAQDEEE